MTRERRRRRAPSTFRVREGGARRHAHLSRLVIDPELAEAVVPPRVHPTVARQPALLGLSRGEKVADEREQQREEDGGKTAGRRARGGNTSCPHSEHPKAAGRASSSAANGSARRDGKNTFWRITKRGKRLGSGRSGHGQSNSTRSVALLVLVLVQVLVS